MGSFSGILAQNVTGPLTICSNTIRANAGGGIWLESSSPAICKNLVTGNGVGIHSAGGAHPLIGGDIANGNDIYANTSYGVQNVDPNVTINAQYKQRVSLS